MPKTHKGNVDLLKNTVDVYNSVSVNGKQIPTSAGVIDQVQTGGGTAEVGIVVNDGGSVNKQRRKIGIGARRNIDPKEPGCSSERARKKPCWFCVKSTDEEIKKTAKSHAMVGCSRWQATERGKTYLTAIRATRGGLSLREWRKKRSSGGRS